MREYVVQRAVPSDVKQMYEIECASFNAPWSEQLLHAEILNKEALCLCAKYKDNVIGFIVLNVMYDEIHITNLAVRDNMRRIGIGENLLKTAIDAVHESGFNDITLEVRVSNRAAISLYEKSGFVSDGIRPKYYCDNDEDALIMWLRRNHGE